MTMETGGATVGGLVRSFWSVSGPQEGGGLPGIVVPDSHVEFVFHLAESWWTQRLGQSGWFMQPSAFVCATSRGSLRFRPAGPVSLIAFRVSPVVACCILRRSLDDLWDSAAPLEALIGSEAHALREQLNRCRAEDRFDLLRRWVARRLSDWNAEHAKAQRLFHALLWRSRNGSIAQVSDALGLSARSLRRTFANQAGLSPKAVQQSGRLLEACSLLREAGPLDITSIATSVGFYDHAAFTHTFVDHVGLTPSQFRAEPIAFYEREVGAT